MLGGSGMASIWAAIRFTSRSIGVIGLRSSWAATEMNSSRARTASSNSAMRKYRSSGASNTAMPQFTGFPIRVSDTRGRGSQSEINLARLRLGHDAAVPTSGWPPDVMLRDWKCRPSPGAAGSYSHRAISPFLGFGAGCAPAGAPGWLLAAAALPAPRGLVPPVLPPRQLGRGCRLRLP
jgi:hypothetical protein